MSLYDRIVERDESADALAILKRTGKLPPGFKMVFGAPRRIGGGGKTQDSAPDKKGVAPVDWHQPDIDEELGEFERISKDEGYDLKALMKSAKKGKLSTLSDKDWAALENTDSWETDTQENSRKMARVYGRDIGRIEKQVAKGGAMPAPLVLQRKNGSMTLIGGNTRLMVARAAGVRPTVLMVTAPEKE